MNSNSQSKHRIFVGSNNHKFSAAHMTVFPDGTKERLHGHNFHVQVAIDLCDVALHSFVDFGVIKKALTAGCEAWHERLLLPKLCPFFKILNEDGKKIEFELCGEVYIVPSKDVIMLPIENVVVETLAMDFGGFLINRLSDVLRKDVVSGIEVKVSESPGQGGSYYLNLE